MLTALVRYIHRAKNPTCKISISLRASVCSSTRISPFDPVQWQTTRAYNVRVACTSVIVIQQFDFFVQANKTACFLLKIQALVGSVRFTDFLATPFSLSFFKIQKYTAGHWLMVRQQLSGRLS